MRTLILIVLLFCLGACSSKPIKAWHRDVLARENMQLLADPLIEMMDEQVYYSKEAAHGGQSVGGGGCGCN